MSTNHTSPLQDPFGDECSPHTPIKNSLRSRSGQDRQGYMLSPPPAPKASQRAYRLSNDERRRQDISRIACKLTFDDQEDDEKKHGLRHARNVCHHRDDHCDRDDDGRSTNSIRFDGTYTFMDETAESSTKNQAPKTSARKPSLASKMLGSPIQIHPAHLSPPQSLSSNSDTLQSSSSTLLDSPFSVEDDSNLGRKRARSIGEEDPDYNQSVPLSDAQNFRSTQSSNHIENHKHTTANQSIQEAYTDPSSNLTLQHTLGEPFDPSMKSSSNTPFTVQLQRTATHSGTNETIQQSIPFTKQANLLRPLQEHSEMHRSVSNASYMVCTPNELREAQSSKVIVAPRLKYNMATRSIHHSKQSRHYNRGTFNLSTPPLCASFTKSNSPSPVIANTTLPNVFSSQPMDYFGSWSAASSPLAQAH